MFVDVLRNGYWVNSRKGVVVEIKDDKIKVDTYQTGKRWYAKHNVHFRHKNKEAMMENNVYVIEYEGPNYFDGNSHFVVVVAAENASTAQQHVKDKIGLNLEPVLLLNVTYPTIYTQNGSSPEPIQAKILYNGNCHFYKTKKQ